MAQMLERGYPGHEHTNNVKSTVWTCGKLSLPSLEKEKDPGG
jgi:hypothetical protein